MLYHTKEFKPTWALGPFQDGGGLNTVTFSLGANSERATPGSRDHTLLCRKFPPKQGQGRWGGVGGGDGGEREQPVSRPGPGKGGSRGHAPGALLAGESHQWESHVSSKGNKLKLLGRGRTSGWLGTEPRHLPGTLPARSPPPQLCWDTWEILVPLGQCRGRTFGRWDNCCVLLLSEL